MNKEQCKRWIEALRSGKFMQGKKVLRKDNEFCCLGVAAELAGVLVDVSEGGPKEYGVWNETEDVYNMTTYTFHSYTFHPDFDGNGEPKCPELKRKWNEEYGEDNLAGMNDGGMSFSQIADVIEQDILPLCKEETFTTSEAPPVSEDSSDAR